jgi:hypothetical protein
MKGVTMLRKYCYFLSLTAMVCFSPAQAAEEGTRIDVPEGVVLRPHLYGHFESGQIVRGNLMPQLITVVKSSNSDPYDINHVWVEDAVIECGFDAIYREQLKLAFTLGTKLYYSYPMVYPQKYTKNLRQDVYMGDLYAQYHVGDIAMPFFLGQIGYFIFKYNPDCRNFGDYLFRTGTYPIWFNMSFDAPWSRLLGMHAQTNLFHSLKLDLLLISATVVPAMNWSLAGLVNYDVAGLHFINIGAGIEGANLFSVYSKDFSYYYGGDPTSPHSGINSRYITKNGDTAYYTFQGTKVMGRISIDPKAFLPKEFNVFGLPFRFGENDLKLYAEADIIGLKSYPDSGLAGAGGTWDLIAPSYNKLWQKMPVAFGFNVPTFKLLDVLNGEIEWFGARYFNDATYLMNLGDSPLPMYPANYFWDRSHTPEKSFLKWSVYAKKSFLGGHFAITGQIGRDHMVTSCADYNSQFWNELLVTAKDWGWDLKTSWMF